jgi:probable addiction module antidote protein
VDNTRQGRITLKLLNRALDGANEDEVLVLLNEMIDCQNKLHFAMQSGLNRVTLYRGFSPNSSPRLDTVLKALDAFGMQLRCRRKTTQKCCHPEHAQMSAELLSSAFATNNLEAICRAFGETVHAQQNIAEFARRASISRMSLYRWLQAGNALYFRSALKITSALGLRLEVAWRSN